MNREYLDAFLAESTENVEKLEDGCLELERQGPEANLVAELFRAAHTLKGMSATMGFSRLAELTHRVEDVFGLWRDHPESFQPEQVDILFQAIDRMRVHLEAISTSGSEPDLKDDDVMASLQTAFQAREPLHPSQKNGLEEDRARYATEAERQGKVAYRLHIQLTSDCMMPAVRLAMVYQTLKDAADIAAAEPTEDAVWAGDVQTTEAYVVVYLERDEIERIQEKVLDITDVARCDAERWVASRGSASQQDSRGKFASQETRSQSMSTTPAESAARPGSNDSRPDRSIRVSVRRMDALLNTMSEMVIAKTRLDTIAAASNDPALREAVERLDRLTKDLQDEVMQLRMAPVESVFHRYPRMMRDLERKLNREFDFVMTGLETEMDRIVLEEMGEVIVHLLRNAVDHGLEPPEVREQQGKSRRGTIRLSAYASGGHIYIEVADDGAGIDRARVLQSAITKGVITPEAGASMSDEAVYELLFQSGFSTAKEVSDISGRGVGLDAVRDKVESLGGKIRIDTELGRGTTFVIELPLTLAILPALLVSVRGQTFAIPTANVDEVVRLREADVRYVQNESVYPSGDRIVPIIDVAEWLGLGVRRWVFPQTAVVCRNGEQKFVMVVDRVLDELEIVNKPLGRYLEGVRGFSGATILGDGKVSLILDVRSIGQSA
ncbi:chemotaxis protein CheA [Alicyclobacillus mali]|uniref:Chemotaxis protein CheA n=1 Tax=Alicyclobacillus mali (ex Roth et al. 2021) TaxID=1123961 RepID=A0ABS0F751_9BACL|nr:chemotaxis protein CheA [Alicyclobacillus mali (ex Roth et al. 2021)]MBF8379135.1 chemotaxis protein CheA [Alicyclobacillus mali (ex Roth et al. 2021)]